MTDRREPTVCWDCHEPEGHLSFCEFAPKPKPEPSSFAKRAFWAAVAGLVAGVFAAMVALGGCTPAQQLTATNATVTGARIAACVQSVLAEEERARLVERRLAEEAAELEAERIADAAREHPQATKDAVNEVLREGSK